MSDADIARERFLSGFLCSQSVFSTFASRLGLPEESAYKIATPFGAGMGLSGGTCGAVTGGLMVLGLKYGNSSVEDEAGEALARQKASEFMAEFIGRHSSLICSQLQGFDLADPDQVQAARQAGVFEKICPFLVRDAAEILSVMFSDT